MWGTQLLLIHSMEQTGSQEHSLFKDLQASKAPRGRKVHQDHPELQVSPALLDPREHQVNKGHPGQTESLGCRENRDRQAKKETLGHQGLTESQALKVIPGLPVLMGRQAPKETKETREKV